jgi:alcohol dehydrogenase class IV
MKKYPFQFAFRTVVHSGTGSRSMLPDLIRGLGGERAVLFTDQGLVKAGVAEKITELFQQENSDVQLVGIFEEIEQDAHAEVINRGVAYIKSCKADALIALGGGSVIDTVKGVKWALHKNLTDIREELQGNMRERWPKAQPMEIPHIAIPTTAGTGAEVSPIAVVFDERTGVKCNMNHPFVSADMAILDPELTVGLPPKITAFTGFDALTHAIEAYFSPKHHPMADALALHAIRLIAGHLKTAVQEGGDLDARARMLEASTMACTAFGLTLHAIPVHNMAHAFGAKFGIPHGLANAVLLPNVMESLSPFYQGRIHGLAEALGLRDVTADPDQCVGQIVAYLRAWRADCGLPDTFAEFKIDPAALATIVEAVQSDPTAVGYALPAELIEKVSSEVAGTFSTERS